MNHFSRQGTLNQILAAGVVLAAGTAPLLCPSTTSAQMSNALGDSPAYLLLHSSQGYLGVTLQDIDSDRAAALKLKEAKGAEIITVDHDAPAGTVGLQSHDVVVQFNGEAIEGAEQLRRILREIPPGRTVNFVVIRDGQPMNLSTALVDRREFEHQMWGQHVNHPEPEGDLPSAGFLSGQSAGGPGLFLDVWPMTVGSLSVGAALKPLTPQLAGYFGVTDGVGLLVENVDGKSAAAAAGLKAGDVVLKVNEDTMATRADWQRVLRANQGKDVQVTLLREKKQMQVTLRAGNLKKKGALELPAFPAPDFSDPAFSDKDSQKLVAELDDLRESIGDIDADAIASQAREAIGNIDLDVLREQAEQSVKDIDVDAIREQAEQAVKDIDVDAIREQAEQAVKDIDVDAIREQAERTVKDIDVDAIRKQAEQATRQMKKQLEEMQQQLDRTLPQ